MSPPVETLACGYGAVEGLRVSTCGSLYFADKANGGVYRRRPDGQIETVLARRRRPGGVLLHADGGVVVSGAELIHFDGVRTRPLFCLPDVVGFNDLFADRQGRVYAGTLRTSSFRPTAGDRVPGDLWRIDAPGSATLLCDDLLLANGIGQSPDSSTLYVVDSTRRQILAFDLLEDGGLENRRVFHQFDEGYPGGLAVDVEGGVWTAIYARSAVVRVRADGTRGGSFQVPARAVTSLCFGGPGNDELYVASADNADHPAKKGCIFRLPASVPGLPDRPARI